MNQKIKYKNLYAKDCEVLEIYRNKVIVKVSENKNLIAKKIGSIKRGEKVNLFKIPVINKFVEIFIYLSPIYYLFLGFIFGFLFYNQTYHYLLILGMSILGFIQLFVLKYIIKKLPSNFYIAVKN